MLFLFVMYSTSNAFQWTQLVIITNILEKYYQVETIYVSWTSMIFMATYIPLIFPATWFLQKKVSTIEIWGVNGLNKSNRMDKIEIDIDSSLWIFTLCKMSRVKQRNHSQQSAAWFRVERCITRLKKGSFYGSVLPKKLSYKCHISKIVTSKKIWAGLLFWSYNLLVQYM